MTTQMIRNVNFKLFKKLLGKSQIRHITIDIGSTVINVEGDQEGTAKGYNPKKPGNRCYNIILAFCDEIKAYITGFTRSGNTYTSNGAAEMITEIIANLKDSVDTITFRMDSGYFDEAIIKTIERAGYNYIIKAKQYGNLLDKLYKNDSVLWAGYDVDKEIAEINMQQDKWDQPRRFVVVRRLKPAEDRKQLSLIEGNDYEYAFYVTNTARSDEETARCCEKRGNCENYIKEAKYDMNVGSLLLKSFWANEAVFQLMMLAYNLFLLFKFDRLISREYRQQIKTFRLKYLFVAGRIIRTARSTILKLAFDYPYKDVYLRYAG
ncbi:MAG: transposase [Firmicutes bacterium]|nr:transposase [Bacillota bacterium]